MAKQRSPGAKFAWVIVIGLLLTIPLFSVWLMVYDRQNEADTARTSIAAGWGSAQTFSGPLLAIPYKTIVTETVTENGKDVSHTTEQWKEFYLAPEASNISTQVLPEKRKRSIYEVVVYTAKVSGEARFSLPADLARSGISTANLALDRAELRFGLSDPRGLVGQPPRVSSGGRPLALQPGHGTASTGGSGFFAWLDASGLASAPIGVSYGYDFRGNGAIALAPKAGDTRWQVRGSWASPSFNGGFLPVSRRVDDKGFDAQYRVGNLALGQGLAAIGDGGSDPAPELNSEQANSQQAGIELVQPVDLYSQVNRSAKYGFLFIGFTFAAFLLFDLVGGVPVSGPEYLLVGAALVLFFILLLAFAEVIGFGRAYVLASAAIVSLNTAYSSAVLGSWRRALLIGSLLTGLYVVLYVLISLEAYSLLIGSVLLFVALAGVMYLTRHLNWSDLQKPEQAEPAEQPQTA